MRHSSAKVIAIAVLGLSVACGEAAAKTPSPQPLPLLSEGAKCSATALNVNRLIVGVCDGTPVRWDHRRTIESLPTPDGYNCTPKGINKKGQVAGICTAQGQETLAVLWDSKGKLSDRLPHGDGDEMAYDINLQGEILGNFQATGAGVFDLKTSEYRQLEILDEGSLLKLNAINYRGLVAGGTLTNDAGGPIEAVIWSKSSVPRRLLRLDVPGNDSVARDINNRGEAVGASGGIESIYMPLGTFWETDGTPRVLEPLPDDEYSDANGVNRQGEAVGLSFSDSGPGLRAILWDRSGTPIELPALEGHQSAEATAINDLGEIIGWSSPEGGNAVPVIWR